MKSIVTLTASWFVAAAAFTARADSIAIKAGRVIPVVGDELKNATIVIENGMIKAIGQDVAVPLDAILIDAGDKVVFPGLVEAQTQGGLDQPNETGVSVTPFVNVYDALDPLSFYLEDVPREGITTMLVIAGNNCIIGGMGRVIKPSGALNVEDLTVDPMGGLKLATSPRMGANRMTHMADMRKAFLELDRAIEDLAEKKYADKKKEESGKDEVHYDPTAARKEGRALIGDADIDERFRNLYALTQGKVPAYIYCGEPQDVLPAIQLARERGFLARTTFVLGTSCWKAKDELKEAGRPVILSPELIHREIDPVTLEEKETFVPGVFAKENIPFAFQRTNEVDMARSHLWYQAALAVRQGMDRSLALKAITLTPAQIIGQGERLGSLEPGKVGNLVILTGDPLSATTWVDQVVLEGKVIYERAKDKRLKKLTDPTRAKEES
ncbi:MAG: amidohydrolase family protein [Planctomycetota bacterium]